MLCHTRLSLLYPPVLGPLYTMSGGEQGVVGRGGPSAVLIEFHSSVNIGVFPAYICRSTENASHLTT